jgi:hypothetical protein
MCRVIQNKQLAFLFNTCINKLPGVKPQKHFLLFARCLANHEQQVRSGIGKGKILTKYVPSYSTQTIGSFVQLLQTHCHEIYPWRYQIVRQVEHKVFWQKIMKFLKANNNEYSIQKMYSCVSCYRNK